MTGTLKTFTLEHVVGQKCSHESAELGLYLAHSAKPGGCQLDVQGD
jgi:hypothetical protein